MILINFFPVKVYEIQEICNLYIYIYVLARTGYSQYKYINRFYPYLPKYTKKV